METSTEYVRRKLERNRGQWKRISGESGVPYSTIKNLMQGLVNDPRTSTIDRLREYFRREQSAA
jgi:predicted transcriptional regulator